MLSVNVRRQCAAPTVNAMRGVVAEFTLHPRLLLWNSNLLWRTPSNVISCNWCASKKSTASGRLLRTVATRQL